MTIETRTLLDEPARVRVRTELETSIFVEAGAGSGKTREMVERICTMVDAGVELRSIVAITFTDKAAGELRERVRRELSHEPDEAEKDAQLRAIALNQLDGAPIGTIHAFAARLISEHPIEAGVPPLIEVVDELRSQIAFNARWDQVVSALFRDASADRALRVLLALNTTLDNLKEVGRGLDANWDRLSSHQPDARHVPDLDPSPLIRQCLDLIAMGEHCTNPESQLLAKGLRNLRLWLPNLESAKASGDLGLVLAALRSVPRTFLKGGAKGHWLVPVQRVRDAAQDLLDAVDASVAALVQPSIQSVTAIMCRIFRSEATLRQRRGKLEYHDLLIVARDLLVGEDRSELQAALHLRYQCIMLDEFQDTDPIQAEIALRLASDVVCGADGWESLPIPAGRLFTVGDPKQSIYRFRRADIATYLQAKERALTGRGSSVAELSTNFRSTPAVLRWINATFAELIKENGHIQPAYTPLAPNPSRPELTGDGGPAVSVVGRAGAVPSNGERATAAERNEQEAADVAQAIRLALGHFGSPWQKQYGESAAFWVSPVELRDICILLPTRTALPYIEDALDAAGIEFRAEASSLVYATQEVHDVLLILRALANTVDEAALALSLRTPWLACGDDDLLRWKQAGGSWHLHAPAPDSMDDSPVGLALGYLRQLSRGLAYRSPAETMDRIISDRRILEAATDSPRYRDVWRRLRFVVDQARAWSEATHGSLRDYLLWAETQQEEGAKVKEAVVPETDSQAVRIMTIHASKGLEFPMVVLAGAGAAPRGSSDRVLWDGDGQLQVQFLKGIETAGFAEAKGAEAELLEAETRRLLYVACTRAESHLVVSLYNGSARSLGGLLQSVDDPELVPELEFPDEPAPANTRAAELEVSPVPPLKEWRALRHGWERLSAFVSATSVTSEAKSGGPSHASPHGPAGQITFASSTGTGGAASVEGILPAYSGLTGEHGANFGTAFHRLMELSQLQSDSDFDALAATVAGQFGLSDPASLESLARSALASEPIQRAAARERWHELPVAALRGYVVLEGIIDLLYREDDGSLVVVDFKTDIGVSGQTLAGYWNQLAAYAELVYQITGQTVSELVLIFCRPGTAEVRRQSLAVAPV
ncbi:MAG: UvrD-helicase domain-containing protein [Actinomycetota bacterium]|nr:UvrD-helicase domain-containing protein [Actinomycetota bacterium]